MSIFDQIVITSYNENTDFYDSNLICICNLKQQSFLRRNWVVLCVRTFDDGKRRRKWRTKSKRIIITAVIEYMSNKVS